MKGWSPTDLNNLDMTDVSRFLIVRICLEDLHTPALKQERHLRQISMKERSNEEDSVVRRQQRLVELLRSSSSCLSASPSAEALGCDLIESVEI